MQPALDGRWHWTGTTTVQFEATHRFPFATDFTVTVPAGVSVCRLDQMSLLLLRNNICARQHSRYSPLFQFQHQHPPDDHEYVVSTHHIRHFSLHIGYPSAPVIQTLTPLFLVEFDQVSLQPCVLLYLPCAAARQCRGCAQQHCD